jgi:hypothetical protein
VKRLRALLRRAGDAAVDIALWCAGFDAKQFDLRVGPELAWNDDP